MFLLGVIDIPMAEGSVGDRYRVSITYWLIYLNRQQISTDFKFAFALRVDCGVSLDAHVYLFYFLFYLYSEHFENALQDFCDNVNDVKVFCD